MVTTDSYAEPYRDRGEIYYENGKNKWIRSFASGVVLGVLVILKQGGKTFSLVFVVETPTSEMYSVTASLLTYPKSTDGFNADLSI